MATKGSLWEGQNLYQLYEAYMPWEWHEGLFKYARKIGIEIFSSPFDFTAVDLLSTCAGLYCIIPNFGYPSYQTLC